MSNCRQVIMTDWTTASGRFTEEEMKIIESWERKVGFNDNQTVRAGVSLLIGFFSLIEVYLRPDFDPIKKYALKINKIMDSPKYKKDLNTIQEQFITEFKEDQLETIDKEWQNIVNELQTFEKHDKPGRKPKQKKPGRPKDTGI